MVQAHCTGQKEDYLPQEALDRSLQRGSREGSNAAGGSATGHGTRVGHHVVSLATLAGSVARKCRASDSMVVAALGSGLSSNGKKVGGGLSRSREIHPLSFAAVATAVGQIVLFAST